MEKVQIERLDDFGRGIGYINNKVVFIPNTLPGELVQIEVIEDKKNYSVGKLINIEKESNKRITPICKYYGKCGGCHLQILNYQDTLDYKLNKVKNILLKNKVYDGNIDIIKNEDNTYYRNKIELKIRDGKKGFYQEKSHTLVEIDECLVTKKCINNIINDIKLINADVTIRANYNDELLLIINTEEEFDYQNLLSHKIVGIILNNKLVYGEDYFTEVINDLYFKVSYDSFFQVNEYICSKLFDLISSNIDENSNVLDLYCGVGTLSLIASFKANKVYGIEIIENAILNAITNAKINKKDNLYFMCGDVLKLVDKINDKIDTVIVDPPRAGLEKDVITKILEYKPNKIIYVSCDPHTLARDLQELTNYYKINKVTVLDMFSYSYHCETFVVLERKSII